MPKKNNQPVSSHKMPLDPKPNQWAWQQQGLCRYVGTEAFFYEDQERGEDKQRRIRTAIKTCSQCPVILQCREFAITTGQQHGIWGGMTEEELAKERKARDGKSTRLTTIIEAC
jgi:WhiB family redox-sensing transcriptional regulator